jgi:hypothetical protein
MALWDSLNNEGRSKLLPVEASLCEQLDRLRAAHLQNQTDSVPWDQVRS